MEEELPVEKIEDKIEENITSSLEEMDYEYLSNLEELDDHLEDDVKIEIIEDTEIVRNIMRRARDNPELTRMPLIWTRSYLEWIYAGVATYEERNILNRNSLGKEYISGYQYFFNILTDITNNFKENWWEYKYL